MNLPKSLHFLLVKAIPLPSPPSCPAKDSISSNSESGLGIVSIAHRLSALVGKPQKIEPRFQDEIY